MDSLDERLSDMEALFSEYKTKTDQKILELENKLIKRSERSERSEPICMIKEELNITIVKYKKSLLVKSTYDYNTTQPYKDLFKQLDGKWMKTVETSGWIYLGKCQDTLVEKNSKFIINLLKEKEIEYTVIYE